MKKPDEMDQKYWALSNSNSEYGESFRFKKAYFEYDMEKWRKSSPTQTPTPKVKT